ncbi:MAG: hypothetical protein ACOYD6_05255 [Limnochordia bacterium]
MFIESQYLLILALFCILLGFIWGRFTGKREGWWSGRNTAPLEIRERSIRQGKCLICSQELSPTVEKNLTGNSSHGYTSD